MNILFIYDAPLCPENGGTERATKLVMDELERRGHICTGLLHYNQQYPEIQYLNNERIVSVTDFLSKSHYDVVVNQIAFHPRFISQFLSMGGYEWQKKGGRIISFMHLDPTPPPRKPLHKYFQDWNTKPLLGKLKRLLYILSLPILDYINYKQYCKGLRFIYNNSDYYILLSETFRKPFIKLSHIIDQSKIRVIPNMLTYANISDPNTIKNKKNMVIVVARLDDEQKNISYIIDIWNSIVDHQGYSLHIIGDGKDRDMLIGKASGNQDIIFEGSQSPKKWYEEAKIFLMASPREGWGLTITESLQHGVVPIILNTSSVFSDIITHGYNGFLPENRKEYIYYLERLLREEKYLGKIAETALNSSRLFSANVVGDRWEDILNSL